MKVIDLLNKIANGEEVPRKFMVDGDTLYIGEDKFIEYANGERIEWFIYPSWLNEEVEIIEEDKEKPISKLYINNELQYDLEDKKIEKLSFGDVSGTPKRANENDIIDKINEIIDKINKKESE